MLAIFPEIAAVAATRDIETLACLVRKYFGGNQTYSPRLDLKEVIRKAGLSLARINIDSFGAIAAKDEAGGFEVDILLPTSPNSTQEENFLIAHLLGHYLLHIQPYLLRGEWSNTGYKENYRPLLRYQQANYGDGSKEELAREREADEFAASILLPKALLQRATQKLSDLNQLGTFFDVSPLMLQRRLDDIGGVQDLAPQNFMEAESLHQNSDTHREDSAEVSQESHQTKMKKAKFSMGQSSYQSNSRQEKLIPEDIKTDLAPKNETPVQKNPLEKSLKMFRQLANRLDNSVDVK